MERNQVRAKNNALRNCASLAQYYIVRSAGWRNAEDLVQEVMLYVVEHAPFLLETGGCSQNKRRAILKRVAQNVVVQFYKQQARATHLQSVAGRYYDALSSHRESTKHSRMNIQHVQGKARAIGTTTSNELANLLDDCTQFNDTQPTLPLIAAACKTSTYRIKQVAAELRKES